MLRWTFLDFGFLKAMIHYFPADVTDRDPHDHPRPFGTLVLRGAYRDTEWLDGDVNAETLVTGCFRYRPARYMHIVETYSKRDAWTLVVMGPITREWGFMRLDTGSWWPWGKYIQRFGGVTRCDAPPDKMGQ